MQVELGDIKYSLYVINLGALRCFASPVFGRILVTLMVKIFIIGD